MAFPRSPRTERIFQQSVKGTPEVVAKRLNEAVSMAIETDTKGKVDPDRFIAVNEILVALSKVTDDSLFEFRDHLVKVTK